jgi:hypothetical protein
MRPGNDTIEVVVYRYDAPVIDFGLEETEYIYDSEFIIDAGFQPYYSYQWQDDSTRHAYTVVQSGDYSVSVTDTRTSCYSGDTVKVYLIYNDVGITEAEFPAEGCTGAFENVKVRVSNLGATNLGSEMPIYIGCKVNDVFVAKDTLRRTANFAPGTYLDLVFTADIPVVEEGINNISFYTIFGDDDKKTMTHWKWLLPDFLHLWWISVILTECCVQISPMASMQVRATRLTCGRMGLQEGCIM